MNTLKSDKHMKCITNMNQVEMGGLYRLHNVVLEDETRFMAIEIIEDADDALLGKKLKCLNVKKGTTFTIPLYSLERLIEQEKLDRIGWG